jgi:hypothetical protein
MVPQLLKLNKASKNKGILVKVPVRHMRNVRKIKLLVVGGKSKIGPV